ncbi:MAG TPA: universal stress protein [Acidimicrobiales bacterium]|jgi:nucleotide-binding universal stress UspA family protein
MFERIVVGVSQVESATRAAKAALALAELSDATVHLVCAIDQSERGTPISDMVPGVVLASSKPPDHAPGQVKAQSHAEHFLERVARETKVRTQGHVLPGDPAEAILQVAKEVDADLIVVGNRGMHGARRVLGSVPNTLSHHADCSVLIVQTV